MGGSPELEPEWVQRITDFQYLLRRIEPADIPSIYAHAEMLVYPSRYEGFGLPVLEGLTYGCPVVTCNNSSLYEVGGDACLYVSEDDPAQLASTIERILDFYSDSRDRMIATGKIQSEKFSWDRSGERLAALLKEHVESIVKLRHSS